METSKALHGRVTNVNRALASGPRVAASHHMALGKKGGCPIRGDSQAGKEFEAFMRKLEEKHYGALTPVKVENGI